MRMLAAEAVTVNANVAISILLCFEVLLFALGGFVVRYEMRRSAAEARLVPAREEQAGARQRALRANAVARR